ncbi:MAG: hypothetical protein ACPGC9_01460 [Cytophagales bacterium]
MADITTYDYTYAYCIGLFAIGLAASMMLWGISKVASESTKAIARQPEAADKINSATRLPIFLMEGGALIAMLFVMVFFLMK